MIQDKPVHFDIIRGNEYAKLRARSERSGPESNLVQQFISNMPLEIPKHCCVTVFQEPKIMSGFPDIVVVFWNKKIAMQWNDTRRNISKEDIRIIHFLTTQGPQIENRIEYVMQKRVRRILDRLSDIGLIAEHDGKWQASDLRKIFAVQNIISFEAKISKWRNAIEQATLNKWFTSESYVLFPHLLKNHDEIVDIANKFSVGIWIIGDLKPILECKLDNIKQPVSYASWLFNEWTWRCAKENSQILKENVI